MGALTADRDTRMKQIGVLTLPVKTGVTIYHGSMVSVDGTGYAIPAANTASTVLMGVSVSADIVAGASASGTFSVEVDIDGLFLFAKSSAAVTDIGVQMYVTDDQTVSASETQSIEAGVCVGFVGTTQVWIRLRSPEVF